jgi:hypothetical protein
MTNYDMTNYEMPNYDMPNYDMPNYEMPNYDPPYVKKSEIRFRHIGTPKLRFYHVLLTCAEVSAAVVEVETVEVTR